MPARELVSAKNSMHRRLAQDWPSKSHRLPLGQPRRFAMKASVFAAFAALARVVVVGAGGVDPLGAVVQLLGELTTKILKEGEDEAKAYKEFVDWCHETSANGDFALKSASDQKEQLEAKVAELTSNAQVATTKIEEHAASVASAQGELKDATEVRKKEAADFAASEGELTDAMKTLERAIAILEREVAKNPAASLAQVDAAGAAKTLQALSAVLDAAALSGSDQQTLMSLAQQHDQAEDSELEAPGASAYKSQSGSIVDVLEDIKEKAEAQLADLRKAEVTAKHNFEMVEQSLSDQIKADTTGLEAEKSAKAAAEEAKAEATGDLQRVVESLSNPRRAYTRPRAVAWRRPRTTRPRLRLAARS